MKILFTGASSFTGSWIVPALSRAGHEVTVTLSGHGLDAYEGLRRKRVEHVLRFARAVWATESGDDRFIKLCRDEGPWDLLSLHGAEVGDYKAATFDWQMALARNTRSYAKMFAAFSAAGGNAVVVTGSYFEADEGNPGGPSQASSPYGLSKTLTWQACRYECLRAGLALGKFVIPNPVGPFEEPKLVASLVREWQRGGVPHLRTPLDVCDHVPVNLLASDYADFVATIAHADAGSNPCHRPSGWVESVEVFSQRVAREFGRLSRGSYAVTSEPQNLRSATLVRRNAARGSFAYPAELEPSFWRGWYDFYFPIAVGDRSPSASRAISAHAL